MGGKEGDRDSDKQRETEREIGKQVVKKTAKDRESARQDKDEKAHVCERETGTKSEKTKRVDAGVMLAGSKERSDKSMTATKCKQCRLRTDMHELTGTARRHPEDDEAAVAGDDAREGRRKEETREVGALNLRHFGVGDTAVRAGSLHCVRPGLHGRACKSVLRYQGLAGSRR